MRDFEFSDLDTILHLAAAQTASPSVRVALRVARIGLRSQRPLVPWRLDDEVTTAIRQACGEEPSDQLRTSLNDVLMCLQGDVAVSVIADKWKIPYSLLPPPDPAVELAAFRPGRVLDKDSERRFLDHLEMGTPLEVILRGHLWVEAALLRLLAEYTPRPTHLDKARFSFAQRLQLMAALDLIPTGELSAFVTLNKLRNQAAHQLDAAIGGDEEQALVDSLGPQARAASGLDMDEHRNQPFPDRLRRAIATLLVMVDGQHRDLLAIRERERFYHLQVVKVLEQRPGHDRSAPSL
ncbi:hypothetical protein [Micromonospora sp. NPDC005173]|uniref:hypothetical protein n=1 Tax=Micromonospora sp. NPDC005173 TaxID=3157165 RepID=UPI0033A2C4D7